MRAPATMLLALVMACDPKATDPDDGGDEPSGDSGGDSGDDEPPCLETSTALEPGAESGLGFSAEALLEGKLGTTETTLRFADEPASLNPDYRSVELPLTVTLAWTGGEVRRIDSESNPEWDSPYDEVPPDCIDRLEVDVVVEFATEGGEFDERSNTTLTATSVDRASLTGSSISAAGTDLYPPPLQGSLDPTQLFTEGEELRHMVLEGVWTPEGAGGALLVELLVPGPDGEAGQGVLFGTVAKWGQTDDAFE